MTQNSKNTSDRLIRVEERQSNMKITIDEFKRATAKEMGEVKELLTANTEATLIMKETLDGLTAVKRFLIWFTSFILGIGIIIATMVGLHKK